MYKFLVCQLLSFLIYNNFISAEDLSKNPIEIVYHICTMNNWEDIVNEQVECLMTSGLGDACDRLTVTVIGPEIEKVYPIFDNLPFSKKIEVVYAGEDLHLYEFPGVEKVQEIANNNHNAKILYMHSKGVTYHGLPQEKNIHQWRRFMEYFAVCKWEKCIDALDNVDACGVDFIVTSGFPFFAGNYWWARADYVKKCTLYYNTRYDCESFIGTANPKVINFLSSGWNPRLREFFLDEEIIKLLMVFPDGSYQNGIFNWANYYYDESYYQD